MYSNIVVGTDGSDHALEAVRRAGELAQASESASVHIVYAVAPQAEYTVRAVPEGDGIVGEATAPGSPGEKHIGAAKAALAPHGVAVTSHIAAGRPSGVILDVADEVDADLIVVGARGLGALGRFVRGSVSTRIAHHATCDVLIVEHDN
jgi:nucleotide-binding universal stress UspA family protein